MTTARDRRCKAMKEVWLKADEQVYNNNNDRLTAFDQGQPG